MKRHDPCANGWPPRPAANQLRSFIASNSSGAGTVPGASTGASAVLACSGARLGDAPRHHLGTVVRLAAYPGNLSSTSVAAVPGDSGETHFVVVQP